MAQKGRKRPTKPQLKRSRINIGRAIAQLGPFDVAAAQLKVTQRQLKKYLFQPLSKTRRGFNLSPAYQRLYETSRPPLKEIVVKTEKRVRTVKSSSGAVTTQTYLADLKVPKIIQVRRGSPTIAGIKVPRVRIKRTYTSEGEIQERIYTTGTPEEQRLTSVYTHAILLEHETPESSMSIAWQIYTSERNLPISINEIKDQYANGELTKREAASVLTHWKKIYADMSDSWFEEMVDEFAEYDDMDYD